MTASVSMKVSAGMARAASLACTVDTHASTQMPAATLSAVRVPTHRYAFARFTDREPGETAVLAGRIRAVATGCFTADSLRERAAGPVRVAPCRHLDGLASVGDAFSDHLDTLLRPSCVRRRTDGT